MAHYHFEAWINSTKSGNHPANVTITDHYSWSLSDSFDGIEINGKWDPGHGHGRSPAGIVCLNSNQNIVFEMDDFIPMYDKYSVGTEVVGRFMKPPTQLNDNNFTWKIVRVH